MKLPDCFHELLGRKKISLTFNSDTDPVVKWLECHVIVRHLYCNNSSEKA